MAPTGEAEIEVLGWIVGGALIAVLAATVLLIRSGRAVPLPGLAWRSRLRRRDPAKPRGDGRSPDRRGPLERTPMPPLGRRALTRS